MDTRIDPEKVALKYDQIDHIWHPSDKWHMRTKRVIYRFIHSSLKRTHLPHSLTILNAGSAGIDYDLSQAEMFHLDLSRKHLEGIPNAFIGSVEEIPEMGVQFDLILCVGSVINYCNPERVISEFYRTLKPGGYLILEFEKSDTYEFLFRPAFSTDKYYGTTFYQGKTEELWFFRERYILGLLSAAAFRAVRVQRYHILSSLVYRLLKNENFASWFQVFDGIMRWIPFLGRPSSNVIILCRKAGS